MASRVSRRSAALPGRTHCGDLFDRTFQAECSEEERPRIPVRDWSPELVYPSRRRSGHLRNPQHEDPTSHRGRQSHDHAFGRSRQENVGRASHQQVPMFAADRSETLPPQKPGFYFTEDFYSQRKPSYGQGFNGHEQRLVRGVNSGEELPNPLFDLSEGYLPYHFRSNRPMRYQHEGHEHSVASTQRSQVEDAGVENPIFDISKGFPASRWIPRACVAYPQCNRRVKREEVFGSSHCHYAERTNTPPPNSGLRPTVVSSVPDLSEGYKRLARTSNSLRSVVRTTPSSPRASGKGSAREGPCSCDPFVPRLRASAARDPPPNPRLSLSDVPDPQLSQFDVSDSQLSQFDVSDPQLSKFDDSDPQLSQFDVSDQQLSQFDVSDPQLLLFDAADPQVSLSDVPDPHLSQSDVSDPQLSLSEVPNPQPALSDVPDPQLSLSDVPDPQLSLSDVWWGKTTGAESHVCQFCFDSNDGRRLGCCWFVTCHECWVAYIHSKISEELGNPDCPNCHTVLPVDIVLEVLTQEQLVDWLFRLQAAAAHDDDPSEVPELGNFVWGHRTCPLCGFFVTLTARERLLKLLRKKKGFPVTCEGCARKWCFTCQEPWHAGVRCRGWEAAKRLREWAKQVDPLTGEVNARRCPQCKVYIQRDGGCQEMICAACGERFCYGCGKRRYHKFLKPKCHCRSTVCD